MKMDQKSLKFISLNGEVLEKVRGGYTNEESSSASDHACGRGGCGASSGLLISEM